MLIGSPDLNIPIESYSNKLIYYLETYLNGVNREMVSFSSEANRKAKVVLRATLFPNKEFIKDYNKIKNNIGYKTQTMITQYTKCIMQHLGRIAECIILDECINTPAINMICMNIALLKKDIYNEYNGVNYDKYIPFSPSFKHIVVEENGVLRRYNVPDYNPQHTSKDIGWCERGNILNQKKIRLSEIGYFENAKLQVKTSLNYSNVILDNKYLLTPIIYFDLCNDIHKLRQKYPNHLIISAREISNSLSSKIEYYFKIIAAFAIGLVNHINLEDKEIYESKALTYIFNSNIANLIGKDNYDKAIESMIEQARDYKKPIEIYV